MQPICRPATVDDVSRFLVAMSEFDWNNLRGAFADPIEALRAVVAQSQHTFYAEADAPLFLGGLFGNGAVWMISTPWVEHHRKFYLRETKRQRDIMMTMADRLHCAVDVRYPKSLRWLEWLGFTFGEIEDRGSHAVRKVELTR